MARKYYLAMAVGTAAVILMSAGPLAAHDCAENEPMARKAEPTVFADKDRDGKVTREEAKVDAALARSFDRYDTNDDDTLDQAEFARLEGGGTRVAEDNPTVAVAPMEPIEYASSEDDRLRPRYVVHPDPR